VPPSDPQETRCDAFPNKESPACQCPGVTLASIEAHPHQLQSALTNNGLRRQDRVATMHLGTSDNSFPPAFGALKACILSRYIKSYRHLPRTSAWESQPGRPSESEGGD